MPLSNLLGASDNGVEQAFMPAVEACNSPASAAEVETAALWPGKRVAKNPGFRPETILGPIPDLLRAPFVP